jgi:hypothetical protein
MPFNLNDPQLTFECKIILLKVDSNPNPTPYSNLKFHLNSIDSKRTFLWQLGLQEVTRNSSNQSTKHNFNQINLKSSPRPLRTNQTTNKGVFKLYCPITNKTIL